MPPPYFVCPFGGIVGASSHPPNMHWASAIVHCLIQLCSHFVREGEREGLVVTSDQFFNILHSRETKEEQGS